MTTKKLYIPENFDVSSVPGRRFLRVAPAAVRGVVFSLVETLKEARETTFRSGSRILCTKEIARMISEDESELERLLPEAIEWGFAARDDDGALYSPELVAREIRRQERAERRAAREAHEREFLRMVEGGKADPTGTLHQVTSPRNGALGGRPRKGETAEMARVRRERELHDATQQRSIPLMRSISGGETSETGNLNRFSKQVLVSGVSDEKPVSGFSLELEEKRDIDNSCSNPRETPETETAKTPVDPETLNSLVREIISITGFGEVQGPYVVSMSRRWLSEGYDPAIIRELIRKRASDMASRGEKPGHMGAFKGAVEDGMRDQDALLAASEAATGGPELPEHIRAADEAYDLAACESAKLSRDCGGWGAMKKRWPDRARELGLPAECEITREAYRAAYEPDRRVA
ncbi:hypothetical protein [Acetobacter oeni]|uniref:Uncharacterized protein n=1 Tax=Acetobacter oeni TaxID=304077 RepID=A0A511XKV6_9PROT|nr:hypothetical protein [Acetobacter oeni]MBB3883829.1 hypothetical protein [Acetobacter oeni]NHO19830.1 hypothetical protein [Acetobacter oeni]GBR10522.1 hypothetical protein AA21952_3101 [Acetobacter oeni LMG 21952]GEN63581.1 hypothetical protein AOE01nite_18050 [Acetobacter oeni]